MKSRKMMLWFAPLLGLVGCQSVGDDSLEPVDDDDVEIPDLDPVETLKGADRPAHAYNKLPDALLVAPVAAWKYYEQTTCLTDYPPGWNQLSYVEGPQWKTGRAELGYGDGDERTVIPFGPNSGNKCRTQLFRHTFTIDSTRPPTLYSSLVVKLLRDDGAAVYLNGQRIVVDNLDEDDIDFLDFALDEVGGSEEDEFHEHEGLANVLVLGVNVLAVEVHQISATNPDVSFNLALLGRLASSPQNITRAFSSAEATIDQSSPNTRLGGDDECKVDGRSGENNSDTRDQVCLARWNLTGASGVPANATVLAAHIEADVDNDSPDRYEVYQVMTDWSEPNVTWNDSNTASSADWVSGSFGAANLVGGTSSPLTVVNALSETLHFYELPPATVHTWRNQNLPGVAFFNTVNANGIDFDADGVGLELVVTYRVP